MLSQILNIFNLELIFSITSTLLLNIGLIMFVLGVKEPRKTL
jgi:hypothetical protein